MINKDRIIPIEKTDYLSLICTIMGIAEIPYEINPVVDGRVTETESSASQVASEPVKEVNLTGHNEPVLFVPAHDFKGILINGEPVDPADFSSSSDDIIPDGVSLYVARYATGSGGGVSIHCYTPQAE